MEKLFGQGYFLLRYCEWSLDKNGDMAERESEFLCANFTWCANNKEIHGENTVNVGVTLIESQKASIIPQ